MGDACRLDWQQGRNSRDVRWIDKGGKGDVEDVSERPNLLGYDGWACVGSIFSLFFHHQSVRLSCQICWQLL